MSNAPLTAEQLQEAVDALAKHGHQMAAAKAMGLTRNTFQSRLYEAQRQGYRAAPPPLSKQQKAVVEPDAPDFGVKVTAELRKARLTLDDLAGKLGITRGQTLDEIDALKAHGINIVQIADKWTISAAPEPSQSAGRVFEYVSRPDNTFLFGACSDNHLCSKFERLDVLNDLYDRFLEAGVDRVLNAGNWIDGEMSFNQFEIHTHGMEEQLQYLAQHYPYRAGIKTYAIAGEDHEGFYCRRESVDIGKFAERTMREMGREDWVDLGFIEAKIDLINANTGSRASLVVMHPGGGSSYAVSYRPQKIVESLAGGEKPAVLLIGHYHKLSVNLIRNVWAMQIGCTQDQSVFMRKKNLDAHVGGMIVGLEQDPETGAIIGCNPKIIQYFNKDYYNDRWKRVGDVVLPERRIGAG